MEYVRYSLSSVRAFLVMLFLFFQTGMVSAQIQSGSGQISSGFMFDFSNQSYSQSDSAGFQGDFGFVNNEGVNFGNEGFSELNGTGRRYRLLGQGTLDTVSIVPEWTDAAPWVTVSYDFSDGTQGLPISAGELWAVYTREGNYAVMEITGLPEGDFGSSFEFNYKYESDGSRDFPTDDGGGTSGDILTGSAELNTGLMFDMSAQMTGDGSDTTNFQGDFGFVNNEGVNFGNEGFSELNGTGRRYRLLGTGTMDTVNSVPEWSDSAPWVTVSYDSPDGTNYQPISAGELWAVYTREGNYGIIEITGLPDGNFGSSFTFGYKYQPDGTRFFDGQVLELNPVASLLKIAGDNQLTTPGTMFPDSLVVMAIDEDQNPVEGVSITYSFTSVPDTSGSQEILMPTVVTNADGKAFTDVQAGFAGNYAVKAVVDSNMTKSVTFILGAQSISRPDSLTAISLPGAISLDWADVSGATGYHIYRTVDDDNPGNAILFGEAGASHFEDVEVESGATYFYWVKSVDSGGNESEQFAGPVSASPSEVNDPIAGQSQIVKIDGNWQYFDFSIGEQSTSAQFANFNGDIKGTSNEGVNFGNEGAETIGDNRVVLLDAKSIEEVGSVPEWTGDPEPWMSVTWELNYQPVEPGQVWGIYTQEGNYALLEPTYIPNPFGDTLGFKYKYQPDGSRFFVGTPVAEPVDSILAVTGNNQIAGPNERYPDSLVVQVLNAEGEPIRGVDISFRFSSFPDNAEAQQIVSAKAISNIDGMAYTSVISGGIEGEYRVIAEVDSNTSKNVEFTLNVESVAPSHLEIVSGNEQNGFPLDTLSRELKVKLTDQFGEPVKQTRIEFAETDIPMDAESGGFITNDGITVSQVATDQNGEASIRYILGSKPGIYHLRANVAFNDNSVADTVNFMIEALIIPPPDQIVVEGGPGFNNISWSPVDAAREYQIYRATNDDNFENAALLETTSDLSFRDSNVESGTTYFYWVSSVDQAGNMGEGVAGPESGTPSEIADPVSGEGMIVNVNGEGWQYFDFSLGETSNQPEDGAFVGDIRGTSNEGVNFGNENAPGIGDNRIILLEDTTLESVGLLPEYTGERNPWGNVSWYFTGQPVEAGQVWGIYTQEGNYAILEPTYVPAPFGDTLGFRYKYQPDGSSNFGGTEVALTPDSMILVSGNEQVAPPGETLKEDFVVQIVDENGVPVNGIEIQFNISDSPDSSSTGKISNPRVISSEGGLAQTSFMLGDSIGVYVITASVADISQTVEFEVRAEPVPPPNPVQLVDVRGMNGSLLPIWTQSESERFLKYYVYLSEDSETFELVDSTRDRSPADTAKFVENLTNYQTYAVTISVLNEDGQESAFSDTLTGVPNPRPPEVQGVSALTGDGTVELSWQQSVLADEYFSHYLVYSGLEGRGVFVVDSVGVKSDTSAIIRNLENGTAYQFYVVSVNIYGKEGSFSESALATPEITYEEEDVEVTSLINGTTSWIDVDNDGNLDLYITGRASATEPAQSIVYLADGEGGYTTAGANITGIYSGTVYWFDIDGNGFLDLVQSGISSDGPVTEIYFNNEGQLQNAGLSLPALGQNSISTVDIDNDGDTDFFITGATPEGNAVSLVVENKGIPNVEVITTEIPGLLNGSSAWGDFDGDQLSDLLISGEDEGGNYVTLIYRNLGNGSFENINASIQGIYSGQATWFDRDLDQDLDFVITGYTDDDKTNIFTGIYTNEGDSTFSLFYSSQSSAAEKRVANALQEATESSRASVSTADKDNDGDIDAMVNGTDSNGGFTMILNNKGDSVGEEVLENSGSDGSASWVDIDNDGDLDIVLTGSFESGNGTKVLNNTTSIKNTKPTIPDGLTFEARQDTVILSWMPATDKQTPQRALTYNLRIGTEAGLSDVLSVNANLETGSLKTPKAGNTGYKTSYRLRNLPNGTYYWQVQAIDNGFLGSQFTDEQTFEISDSPVSNEEVIIPETFALNQNYPNPFNPSTVISYQLPKADDVTIKVYDITGRLLATLLNSSQNAGKHSVTFDASRLASGMYLYRINTQNGYSETKKMILIK